MIGQGVGIIVLAGILGGSVLAPIKIMRQWRFEKSWAVYSVWAYLLMPWLVALLTIPHLFHIYPQVSGRTMLICALCGVGWGTAVVLYGVAVNIIGLSLTTAILYGASIAVGSLAPLVISHRDRLLSAQGLWIVLADGGIVAGVLLCTWAGRIRDAAKEAGAREAASQAGAHSGFMRGFLAAVLGAILSSLFNIALAYGGEFNRLAIAAGASPLNAANAQWAFTVTFGYLPNILLTIVTFSRRRLWKEMLEGPSSHWLWPPLMGLMFIGGTALYGTGAGHLGSMGPVLGWPIYMSMSIIGGVFWGYVAREWKNVPRSALGYLVCGILVQLGFITLLNLLGK
jgi:L-rhamnose-H+ transport protein